MHLTTIHCVQTCCIYHKLILQVLSIDDIVPGGNVRIRDMIDRAMDACIGVKRLTVLGLTGYPETIPTHVYIHFIHFFELNKFLDDMVKSESLHPGSTKKWIKFVRCHWERDMFQRERVHKEFYSNNCPRCRSYVEGLKDKSIWWFEVGGNKLLKVSFKNFFNEYTTFECCCLWIKIVGMMEVQVSIEGVAEGYDMRRSFRVVRNEIY